VKILHINYTFGGGGGTESYLNLIIEALGARGHASEVAAEEDFTSGSIAPFHALAETEEDAKRWRWRHGGRLRRIVRQVRPDLIHLHNTRNADLVRLATRLRPTIRTVHDHTVFCPGLNKLYADGAVCDRTMGDWCLEKYHRGGCLCFRHPTPEIARHFLKRSRRLLRMHHRLKRLLVGSAYMRQELERVGVAAERIVLNPFYVAIPETEDPSPADEPPLVVTLCRMQHPEKGILPFLDALARIERPFRALLAGDGRDLDMMKERARALGITDRVEFLGRVPHDKAQELLGRARVVAFPSTWAEPFGLAGLEAMARARPVVAYDLGGVSEWLDSGRTGLLVEAGDVDGYAAALTALIDDAGRARAMGLAGRARVKECFAESRHLDVLEDVYRGAVFGG
jgi:glycosyltransferase involved in cell wall biosynthesis